MRIRQLSILGLALAVALPGAATFTAEAHAQPFGQQGDIAFSAERLMGLYFQDEGGSWTGVGLGISGSQHPYSTARFAVDGFIIDKLSLGGSLAIWSWDPERGRGGTGVLLAPRVGYAIDFNGTFGFWPRGGFTYRSFDGDDELALTMEGMFWAAPADNFAFTFGPAIDLGIVGDGPEAKSFGVLTAGLMGWIRRMTGLARLIANALAALTATLAAEAHAFTHVVQPGETLASIAERVYGRIQHERILVAANGLDLQGGLSIVPGMRLEVPAVSYRRVKKTDTWQTIAAESLGSPKRSDVLAIANGTNPWLPAEEGAEIVVPYNLRLVVSSPDTLPQVAYRYLGDAKKAWMLQQYNGVKGIEGRRGDVLLVPLTDLTLSDDGKKEAALAHASEATQAHGETRAGQRKVAGELPALIADVRGGRFVDAVRRGTGFLALTELSTPELATIHRQLLEAYVALGATGLAAASCEAWRKADPGVILDPNLFSPKILKACQAGGQ